MFRGSDEPNESILYRELRPGLIWFDSIFVLTFGGVGLGGLYGMFKHAKHVNKVELA